MSIKAINKYLSSKVNTPFFLAVGDKQYDGIKNELSGLGFIPIKISDYCDNDRLPDIDGLFERLMTAGKKNDSNKLVVVGLGEYLALRGSKVTERALSELKDLNVGNAKVILLLRCVATLVSGLKIDPRFDSRRFSLAGNTDCDLSVTLATSAVGLSALPGIKALLMQLENGGCGNMVVHTTVNLDNSLLTIYKINNAYEAIKHTSLSFNLPYSCGSDIHWAELLKELPQNNSSLDAVFEKNGFVGSLEEDFYRRVAGHEYKNWLYFIALKIRTETLLNSYLRFVLDKTNHFESFKANVLSAIIEVQHTDKQFNKLYADRKILVEKFPESDIADFVVNNRLNPLESVYKLTDSTKTEREEIIAWVSQNGVIPQVADIYPALSAYMKKYVFNCGDLSNLLTEYFDVYKRQKVVNKLEADFMEKVEGLAKSRDYNLLPTRNEIIDGLKNDDTYLYWLDALGVEYLAFISELVRIRGLSIAIRIARAELPTITSINRNFFDDWQGKRKEKCGDLDDTKHRDAGGYNFENNSLPTHLATELDIISKVIDKAATELSLRHCKRFLLVSDHGSSRLAVLLHKEERYETDTKGEHSGRCCKKFEPYDLPFASEENGYLVLADYGRFKGSRAANVEVHGGASFEEVIVPVIELSLKNSNITVKMVEKFIVVDLLEGANVTLFSNYLLNNASIIINDKRYAASSIDDNHYNVVIPDMKRAGNYLADVYEGDDLIEQIMIKAQGKSGRVNNAFDELF